MFSSLRFRSQPTLLCRAARLYTTSLSSSTSSTASLVRIATSTPKAATSVNAFARIPQPSRLFSVLGPQRNPSAYAVKEDAEAEFEGSATEESNSFAGNSKEASLVKFQDLLDHKLIDARIMRSIIQDMKFENMTEVQSKTIRETLKGTDVLAQAKTGTGKTIAFLLPVLQRIITGNPVKKHRLGQPLDIRSIIISPTRELAQQIAREAEMLTKYVPDIKIQTAVGGTGKVSGLRTMHRDGCNILIATPGRLQDLLSDPNSGVDSQNMEVLVLDEADNLLDQGFAEELMNIIKLLPSKDRRQTLLFSATVPPKVQTMINAALKPKHAVLKMVPKGEVPTHARLEQRLITVQGFENLLPTLYEQMMKEIKQSAEASGTGADKPFKAIVFFPTTKFAALGAATFRETKDPESGMNPFYPARIVEIHSRLTQAARERAAKHFRESKSGIMFSSDVVARGMDFPDVTHVFQVGPPRTLEQYIHRVGRTARGATSTGLGYLIISDLERVETLKELRSTIKFNDWTNESAIARLDMSKETVLPKSAAEALMRVMEASQGLAPALKSQAYAANIGYYTYLGDKRKLISTLNRWALLSWGMQSPPKLSPMLAKKMGLVGVEGVMIGRDNIGLDQDSRGTTGRSSSFERVSSMRDREVGFSRAERERGFSTFSRGGDREGGFSRGGDREGGFSRTSNREGGFSRGGEREGGFSRGGESEGGFSRGGDREGGFKPREGSAARDSGFKPREDGSEGGFRPREGSAARDSGFKPREGGSEGGFRPREGSVGRDGGFKPREGGSEGGFRPREGSTGRDGGFKPRVGGSEGGFRPREGSVARDGGFRSREGGSESGYRSREGGFSPREGGFSPREGGFSPREGGFSPREGGFRSREGGFTSREGGYKPREGGSTMREGGIRSREGFTPREPREGGFSREGGSSRDGEYKSRNTGFSRESSSRSMGDEADSYKRPYAPKEGARPLRPWEGRGYQGSKSKRESSFPSSSTGKKFN